MPETPPETASDALHANKYGNATCALPGCETFFRKHREDHRFCCTEHRKVYHSMKQGDTPPILSQMRAEWILVTCGGCEKDYQVIPETPTYRCPYCGAVNRFEDIQDE